MDFDWLGILWCIRINVHVLSVTQVSLTVFNTRMQCCKILPTDLTLIYTRISFDFKPMAARCESCLELGEIQRVTVSKPAILPAFLADKSSVKLVCMKKQFSHMIYYMIKHSEYTCKFALYILSAQVWHSSSKIKCIEEICEAKFSH